MKKFSKKIICGVTAFAVALASIPVIGIDLSGLFTKSEAATNNVYIVSADGDYVYKNTGNDAEVWKYLGDEVDVVVPEVIDGLTVRAIGQEAFTDDASNKTVKINYKNPNLANIESVVLPDTVTSIYASAFDNCTKLKHIELPDELYSIGESAFRDTALTEIELPEKLNYISSYAFMGTNIKELVIPESVDTLYKGSLYCKALEKVIIKGYLKHGYNAFSITTTKHFPEEILFVNSQPSGVIDDFGDIKKNEETGYWEAVVFEGNNWYGYTEEDMFTDGAFDYVVTPENEAIIVSYNSSSKGTLYIDNIRHNYKDIPVVEIGPFAFAECNLEKVYIAPSVKRIHYAAFLNSKNLYSVHLPEGLKVIESETFNGCKNLSLANTGIPESVTEIGAYAFYKCCVGTLGDMSNIEKIGAYAFYNNSIFNFSFKNLKEIAPYAFAYSTFGTINFPEGLEKICDYAFYDSWLEAATFPESLVSIGDYAFERCELKKLVLPQGLEYLGEGAFSTNKFKEIEIPPLLTELKNGVFTDCPILNINIPSNIKVIGAEAFKISDHILNRTISIAEGVEEIHAWAFFGSNVEEITIPSTVKKLSFSSFYYVYTDVLNYNAVEAEIVLSGNSGSFIGSFADGYSTLPVLNFGEGIKRIPKNFAKNSRVKKVNIPESVEYIGDEAFNMCYYLTEINIPSNLKEIGYLTFSGCKFTEIDLPDGLEKIGDCAFEGCYELASINFPDSVKYIGDSAFGSCIDLTEVTLPVNAEYVGQYAFRGCGSLKEVTIPENVKCIGEMTFDFCEEIETVHFRAVSCDIIPISEYDGENLPQSPFITSEKLKTITLYNTVKELPAFLYSGLKNIDKVTLPESVTDIGVGAFANSTVSETESLANIESIEEYAFKNCTYLEEINLGNKLMIIGMEAFSGCDSLKSIYIPDSVSNIEISAFEDCTKLESVRMSPNVDFIPRQAFNNCKSLSEFEWNSNRKLIGRYAFGNCVKLSDFDFVNIEKLYKNSFTGSGVAVAQLGESQNNLNASLETIETQSFMSCESLATIGIGGNVTTVKSQAFADCTNLETAVIADTVTEIAEDAFDGCNKLTIYCAEDSYAHSYAQTQGIKVSTFVIAPIPNQTFTGFEIEPEISVTASGDTLNENIDFGVTYANNINVGTADVNVKGKGDFRMFASRANFSIVTKSIANVSIAEIPAQDYTGNAVTPVITVTDGGKILHEGTDYTVTYSNNTAEGKATAKITGKGNYSGSASAEFEIQKLSEPQSFLSRITGIFNSLFARIKAFIIGIFVR
ncbi:MAG: leucine-rich repeat protein [Acutalibacteraceae bacterium]|nr:leucine-rich repeat protein [Acutalibacteraceae bacterium]